MLSDHAMLTDDEIFALAYKALEDGRIDEAEYRFNYLLNTKSDNPALYFFVGGINLRRKHYTAAEILFKHALKLHLSEKKKMDNAILAAIYNNLGFVASWRQDRNKAREYFLKALSTEPKSPDPMVNIGSLYVNNGTPEKGIEWFDKALAIDPDNAHAKWNASLCHLEAGHYDIGFDWYEAGFQTGDRIDRNYQDGGTPLWDGSPGKRVIVYGEQGIGDEIMYASMLNEMAKTNEVILECHPKLQDLFRNSFDFPVYGTRKAEQITWSNFEEFDAKVSIASLGKFYRRSAESFPFHNGYLRSDESLREEYRARLDALPGKMKVGISWQGGVPRTRGDVRSLPLNKWDGLLKYNNEIDFISLQYTKGAAQEAAEFGVTHWTECNDDYPGVEADFHRKAALIQELDLVISICTTSIHLAGALNVPTWVLTPDRPAWRYGVSGNMLWYPSVKLYRQQNRSWGEVFMAIENDLVKLLNKKAA